MKCPVLIKKILRSKCRLFQIDGQTTVHLEILEEARPSNLIITCEWKSVGRGLHAFGGL